MKVCFGKPKCSQSAGLWNADKTKCMSAKAHYACSARDKYGRWKWQHGNRKFKEESESQDPFVLKVQQWTEKTQGYQQNASKEPTQEGSQRQTPWSAVVNYFTKGTARQLSEGQEKAYGNYPAAVEQKAAAMQPTVAEEEEIHGQNLQSAKSLKGLPKAWQTARKERQKGSKAK